MKLYVGNLLSANEEDLANWFSDRGFAVDRVTIIQRNLKEMSVSVEDYDVNLELAVLLPNGRGRRSWPKLTGNR